MILARMRPILMIANGRLRMIAAGYSTGGGDSKVAAECLSSKEEINSIAVIRPVEKSVLAPQLELNTLEYQDRLELVWNKVRAVRVHRVASYVNWLVQMGEIDSKAILSAITRKLLKYGKSKAAVDLGNWLLSQDRFEVDDRDYVLRVHYYSHIDIYLAEMIFNELSPERRTGEAYNYILAGYARNMMLDKAMEIMDKIRELGYVSTFSLEQMVLLFHRLGLDRRIPALMVEARSLGFDLHPHFLNTYLLIQRKQGDVSGMERTVEELERTRKSNAMTYVVIASAYIRAGSPNKAHAALGAAEAGIRHGRFKKQRSVYNRILRLYGLLKDMDGIERIWGILNKRPLKTMHNFLFMIEALGNAGNVKRAETIFHELKTFCGELKEQRQFVIMAGAYTKNGLMDKAAELLHDFPAKKKVRPISELYHYFIKGYINRNEKDLAIEAYEEGQCVVKHRSTKLWYETMLEVMSIYAERGDVYGASQVFKHCKSCKHRDIRMFTLMFKTYLTAKAPAHGLMKRLLLLGFDPNDEIRELVRQLKPIRQQFEEDRFERKIFGKPHLQWLRFESMEVKRRWFRRGLRRRAKEVVSMVNQLYRREKRVWSSTPEDDDTTNLE